VLRGPVAGPHRRSNSAFDGVLPHNANRRASQSRELPHIDAHFILKADISVAVKINNAHDLYRQVAQIVLRDSERTGAPWTAG
jgi:hypothetical protein